MTGALGFWKALDAIFPTTRHQRCWVHKTSNIVNKLPKSVQPAAKQDLHEVWQAPDRATAEASVAVFAEKYAAKYEKAVTCLVKDRAALLSFYEFSAEHWDHLRIEPDRKRVRHRCGTAPSGPRARCPKTLPGSWCSSSSWPPRKPGID